MANETTRTHADWIGRTVYDRDGDKIGDITDIYYDDRTGRPEWMTVSTGWFGTSEQFVPISGTSPHGDDIRADYTKDMIKDAPSVDADDAHLTEEEEQRLYSHYGFNATAGDMDTMYGGRTRADEGYTYYDRRETGRDETTRGRGTKGTKGKTEATTTRMEDEVSVDKTRREAGRARLKKYVVTEDVDMTVPVKKQVARLTREPARGDRTGRTGEMRDSEEEVVLMEEEIHVDKRPVAKEQVGIAVDEVTEERPVHETVRKERVEVEGDVDRSKGRGKPRR
jgi:uncharacterized protein (TIGR02271 family)